MGYSTKRKLEEEKASKELQGVLLCAAAILGGVFLLAIFSSVTGIAVHFPTFAYW